MVVQHSQSTFVLHDIVLLIGRQGRERDKGRERGREREKRRERERKGGRERGGGGGGGGGERRAWDLWVHKSLNHAV